MTKPKRPRDEEIKDTIIQLVHLFGQMCVRRGLDRASTIEAGIMLILTCAYHSPNSFESALTEILERIKTNAESFKKIPKPTP